MEIVLFDHKRIPGSLCFVLSGCSQFFHICGYFCGTVFHLTEILIFLTGSTPYFFSTVHYSQSKNWFSEQTSKSIFLGRRPNNYWVDIPNLSRPIIRTETSIITGCKVRLQWFTYPRASDLGCVPQMSKRFAILPQNILKGCAAPSHAPASTQAATELSPSDMRPKIEASHCLHPGFFSFFTEGHMLIMVYRTAL